MQLQIEDLKELKTKIKNLEENGFDQDLINAIKRLIRINTIIENHHYNEAECPIYDDDKTLKQIKSINKYIHNYPELKDLYEELKLDLYKIGSNNTDTTRIELTEQVLKISLIVGCPISNKYAFITSSIFKEVYEDILNDNLNNNKIVFIKKKNIS